MLLISVYSLVVICMLVNAFFRQLRYNPYSYNTIYYSGFALFVLSVFITNVLFTAQHFLRPSASGASTLFMYLTWSPSNYMLASAPFIILFSLALIVSNIALIRHEGKRLVNVLGIILAFLMLAGFGVIIGFSNASGSETQVFVQTLINTLLSALYLYFECMIIGIIIASVIVVKYRPDHDKDFIIVLGCGIRKDGTPTPILKGRLDKALAFRDEQLKENGKDLVFVVSGGQGPNEVMPEAECMKNYLISQGIAEDMIITEDKSTDTAENMKFSKEKIMAAGGEGKKIAFCTTNYHVFRGGLKARRVKMRAIGIGSKTRWWFWPNAAVREFVGLLTEHRGKQALILIGLIVFYTVVTVLSFA